MSEHKIQNEGRNALALPGVFGTRVNVGTGWTANKEDIARLPDGSLHMRNPRPFTAGPPVGFSDTFYVVQTIVTPDMLGSVVGIAAFVEFKDIGKEPTKPQSNFIKAMRKLGARAGVAYSVADAMRIVLGRAS